MRPRAIPVAAALLRLPGVAAAEVRSLALAARASRDVGTVFVSGTESGWGGGVSARLSFGGDAVRWEPEVTLDFAGFPAEGDGDPIVQGTILLSRRAFFSRDADDTRAWWSIGAGAGVLRIAGTGGAFPVRVAFGVSLGARSLVGLEASVFNRFTLTTHSGDPGTEYVNATGIELALRFGR